MSSNFFDRSSLRKLFLNIYILFKKMKWFLVLIFKILKTLNSFICSPHVIYQNEAFDLNFQIYMTNTANNPFILVISVNFAKSSVERRAIWRHFEACNEIVWPNRLKIQILDAFFLQHGPVRAYQKAKFSPVFMISVEKRVFGLSELKSSSEQNWALYKHYFPTNSTKIFQLKMVSWPGIA